MSVYAIQQIYTVLDAHSGLAALVGDRIYNLALPQNVTYPCVSFHNVAGERPQTMGGNNFTQNLRIRVHSWGQTLLDAEAVADQVKAAMAAATTFRAIELIWLDQYDPETAIFQTVSDFSIWYNLEIPT